MSKCKHTSTFTTGQYGEPRVRKCNACWTLIPWGPATMIPMVDAELLAARAAAFYAHVEGDLDKFHAALYATLGPTTTYADFYCGLHGTMHCGEYDMGDINDDDHDYQAGALCRAIIEHEESPMPRGAPGRWEHCDIEEIVCSCDCCARSRCLICGHTWKEELAE